MSEANLPQPDHNDLPPGKSELGVNSSQPPNPFGDLSAELSQPVAEEDWVTVDFPQALKVDTIVRSPEPPSSPIQAIQQQNQELLSRVAYLEETLEEARGALLRHDVAQRERQQERETLIHQHHQDLAKVQTRLNQLFQELELSHQTSQRQQILIETLTVQFQASQERVSQLEQELTIAQQRNNEQVQALLQAEDSFRDLRTRLQRQQRYTLQFKAALERCLEMPHHGASSGEEAVAPVELKSPRLVMQTPVPRSQPVQPWSAVVATEELLKFPPLEPLGVESGDSSDRRLSLPEEPPALAEPSPLQARLAELKIMAPDDRPASSKKDLILPLLQTVSPTDTPGSASSEPDASGEELSWDVDADLDEQLHEVMQGMGELPILPEQPDRTIELTTEATEAEATPIAVDDTLWQSLAHLIDLPTGPRQAPQAIHPPQEPSPAPAAPQVVTGTDLFDWWADQTAEDETAEPEPTTPEPAAAQVELTLESNLTADRPSASGEADPFQKQTWPSPVVYPLRSGKKLPSLAAVELPSFPKVAR